MRILKNVFKQIKTMEEEYIGDGVYVSFDGYHIKIQVNDYRSEPVVVVLEPQVMDALIAFHDENKNKTD